MFSQWRFYRRLSSANRGWEVTRFLVSYNHAQPDWLRAATGCHTVYRRTLLLLELKEMAGEPVMIGYLSDLISYMETYDS